MVIVESFPRHLCWFGLSLAFVQGCVSSSGSTSRASGVPGILQDTRPASGQGFAVFVTDSAYRPSEGPTVEPSVRLVRWDPSEILLRWKGGQWVTAPGYPLRPRIVAAMRRFIPMGDWNRKPVLQDAELPSTYYRWDGRRWVAEIKSTGGGGVRTAPIFDTHYKPVFDPNSGKSTPVRPQDPGWRPSRPKPDPVRQPKDKNLGKQTAPKVKPHDDVP